MKAAMNTAVPPDRAPPSGVLASPAGPRPDDLVPRILVSTLGLPPHRQFEAWCDGCVPHLEIARPALRPEDGFAATGAALAFGPFMIYAATVPPYAHGRSAQRIRRDSLDHWMIAICRRGIQRQRGGDDVITFRPGVPYVLSMARAFAAEREGAAFDWLALHVARDAVAHLEPALSAMLYRPMLGATGRLLASHLATLQEGMDGLRGADLPHVANATAALLAAALAPTTDAAMAAQPQVEQLQLTRIRRIIRENIGAATLRPGRLAALSGISRSQLYRLFEPLGGVARHIQGERLRHARRLLCDPAERRDISHIAESAGFFDPSSFSRAFRREFGATPRDYRMAALAGRRPAQQPGRPRDAGGDLITMLRRL